MSVNIIIKNAQKRYGDNIIIEDLSLDIRQGEFFTLLGPSGCGKTTLLRMIAGFNSIENGDFYFNEKRINDLDPSKRNIGMVFQHFNLFPNMTVKENIKLAPVRLQKWTKEEADEKAVELLKRVGLEDKADTYPNKLSGGQKQRVAIVRALLMHPEIILFDEVTASLDPEMVREVLELINDLAQEGRTMILVTHEMQFAREIADRVVFIDGGDILEVAPPAEFFAHPQHARARRFLQKVLDPLHQESLE